MPPENSGFSRSFIEIPPAPNFFRMNPAPKGPGKQDPSKALPNSSAKSVQPDQNKRQPISSQSSNITPSAPEKSTSDEFKLLHGSTNSLSSSMTPSSPTTPATNSWIAVSVESPSFMEDILTLESPPPKSHVLQGYRKSMVDVLPQGPKAMPAFSFAHLANRDSLDSSFANSSFAEIPSLTEDDDSLLIKKVESLQSVQMSPPKSAARTSTTRLTSQDQTENRLAPRSPVLVKFPTNIRKFAGTPTVIPKTSPTTTDEPFDPILGALNSLQHEKSRVEQELASSLNLLSSTKEELTRTKASLCSLKERFQNLNEIIAQIGIDRESLRHGMDEFVTRIDGVKLALVELKSDVYVGRRDIESTRQLDAEISQKLHDLDKELHSKSVTCEMLQDKLDDKSGLLVEERSKVLSLEDRIQKLTGLNESLTEKYNEEKTTAFKMIEDKISRFEDIMDVRFQEYISMIDSIRKLSQEIQEKTISSSTDLTDKFANSDRQREILHKAITDLRDALQNDISVLSSQMAAIRDENTTLQGENTSLRITIVDREKTIELDKSEIGVLQKQLADNKETMVTKDTLEQAKLEISNLTEKYGMLESENMKLQDKLTIAIESRQQIERKLADTDKLLEQHQAKEENLMEQGRAAYESEMAKKEIQFLQARQDYEMEKNNMMKSHATKVEKFRMQLDKIQTDKTHLEKLLQSEIDSHSRTQERVDQLIGDATRMAVDLKGKSDEISGLRKSLEEVSKKLKEYEEGRPNVVLSVPSIFSVPKPPIDMIQQSHSVSDQSSNDKYVRARSFSHFEGEKSDSTQSSVDAFNEIVQNAMRTGVSQCPEASTESNKGPPTSGQDITDGQPDNRETAASSDLEKMQTQKSAVISQTTDQIPEPGTRPATNPPPKSRKRKATSNSTPRQRHARNCVPSAINEVTDARYIDQMATAATTSTTVTTRSRTNTTQD